MHCAGLFAKGGADVVFAGGAKEPVSAGIYLARAVQAAPELLCARTAQGIKRTSANEVQRFNTLGTNTLAEIKDACKR